MLVFVNIYVKIIYWMFIIDINIDFLFFWLNMLIVMLRVRIGNIKYKLFIIWIFWDNIKGKFVIKVL